MCNNYFTQFIFFIALNYICIKVKGFHSLRIQPSKYKLILMTTVVEPQKALQFFNTIGKLKNLKRTGWVNNGNNSIPGI